MNNHIWYWIGKAESVNRWHGARAIRSGHKWIAMIFETPKYKKFKNSMLVVFMADRFQFPKETYVDMQITACLNKTNDTGNFEKAIGDTLEKAGIISNDRFVRNITIIRRYHPGSGTKNKFHDQLMIELTAVPDKEVSFLKIEQSDDLYGLRFK